VKSLQASGQERDTSRPAAPLEAGSAQHDGYLQARAPDRDWLLLRCLLVVVDACLILAALALGYVFRVGPPWRDGWPANWPSYLAGFAGLPVIWTAIFAVRGLYRRSLLLGGPREYSAMFNAWLYGVVAAALAGFIVDSWSVSRSWLVTSFGLALVLLEVGRFAVRRFGYALRARGRFMLDVVLVGASREARTIAQQLNHRSRTGVHVVGFLDDYLPVGAEVLPGLPVLGRSLDGDGRLRQSFAGDFIVVPQALPWETLQAILQQATVEPLRGHIRIAAGSYEMLATAVDVEEYARVPLLALNGISITGLYALAKSLLDVTIAALLLLPSLPLLGIVTLWCRVAGIQDVWQPRLRMGQMKRPITVFELNREAVRMKGGPWLRRVAGHRGIGRLPWLFNVLGRELSLVGPEPRPPDFAGDVQDFLPSLLSVRPGLWSLSASVQDPRRRVELDLYYVRNFSITLDLQVLVIRLLEIVLNRDVEPRVASGGSPSKDVAETDDVDPEPPAPIYSSFSASYR
jgi:lipopolysaccharide/colanic/teichoic acid biosynthesis glycosyltransferase